MHDGWHPEWDVVPDDLWHDDGHSVMQSAVFVIARQKHSQYDVTCLQYGSDCGCGCRESPSRMALNSELLLCIRSVRNCLWVRFSTHLCLMCWTSSFMQSFPAIKLQEVSQIEFIVLIVKSEIWRVAGVQADRLINCRWKSDSLLSCVGLPLQ